jgi:hypothetical protein
MDRVKKAEEAADIALEVYENLANIQDYFEIVANVSADVADIASAVVDCVALSPVLPVKMALWGIKLARKTHEVPKGYKEIYKSEVIKNNISPQWAHFQKGFYELSYSDISVPLLIQIWDWDRIGRSESLGECCITSGHVLLAHKRWVSIDITDPKKKEPAKLYIYSVVSNPEALLKKHQTITFDHVPVGYNPEQKKKETIVERGFGVFSQAVGVANNKLERFNSGAKTMNPFVSKTNSAKKEENVRQEGQPQPNSPTSLNKQPQGNNSAPIHAQSVPSGHNPVPPLPQRNNSAPNQAHNAPNVGHPAPHQPQGNNTAPNLAYTVPNVGHPAPQQPQGNNSAPNLTYNVPNVGHPIPHQPQGHNSALNLGHPVPNTGYTPRSPHGGYNPVPTGGYNPIPYAGHNLVPNNPAPNTGYSPRSPHGGFQVANPGGATQQSYGGGYYNNPAANFAQNQTKPH